MRFKSLAEIFGTSLCIFFLSTSSFATQPTIPIKSKPIRLAIEALRYQSKDSAMLINEKLEKNFSRDCDSFQYHSADTDLSVSTVMGTFPVVEIENYLQRNPTPCPQNADVAIKVIEQKSDKPRAKQAAIRYLTAFQTFDKYPWGSFMWSMIPILDRIGDGCLKREVEVFHHIYCGYLKKENNAQSLSFAREQFQKACPNVKVECG